MAILTLCSPASGKCDFLAPLWMEKWFLTPRASERPLHVRGGMESRVQSLPRTQLHFSSDTKENQPWSLSLPETSHPLHTSLQGVCRAPTASQGCASCDCSHPPLPRGAGQEGPVLPRGECTLAAISGGREPCGYKQERWDEPTSPCVLVLPLTSDVT